MHIADVTLSSPAFANTFVGGSFTYYHSKLLKFDGRVLGFYF
jgi:hypothetical protein